MASSASTSVLQQGVKLMTVDGKALSTADANEHMRILLMAPKYREETQRHLNKQKESPYAPGAAIADNFKRFATKRSDIFASSAEEEAKLMEARNKQETIDEEDEDEAENTISSAPQPYPGHMEMNMPNMQYIPPGQMQANVSL